MRNNDYKLITNRNSLKKLRMSHIYSADGLCTICGPNQGCNRAYSQGVRRSWKKYRKTQYKNHEDINTD